ncbi:ABC transporter ATP-binding protein [Primorskyibacter flagellatus]|uniref:Iron complex transport system ATP-binding protein n=1 Tax=Primorskyibacter flagellatus TaxID=1387277 RepID=A0A1W2CAU4_9RHOB|nr:ATP-binding cassette domain-containing protein [Primorskyibacter flagellatus]SMC82251.1 iron complex transport system ATP-binding protein [Primorskyibacter flagellatus]
MIQIQNVSHVIGKSPILTGITTRIPRHGITALIGPNGAGKSTLLNLIARLTPLQSGQITVDDVDVSTAPTQELALKIAVVAQQLGVSSRLRVRDLVAFGRWPHHRGRPAQRDEDAVDQAIAAFDLQALQYRFLDELSGGQQQRAFVAMGVVQDTDWVLLDEPLNNLDMYHAKELTAGLHAMSRPGTERSRSIVMVVHEINYVAAWADHIVALKDGALVFSGPPDQVLTEPILSDLFGMPIRVVSIDGKPVILHHM